jgi:hypothetical protein
MSIQCLLDFNGQCPFLEMAGPFCSYLLFLAKEISKAGEEEKRDWFS